MIKNWDKFLLPYEQAVEELKIKFRSIRKEYRDTDEYSPIEFVTGRLKKISSIIEKARIRDISSDNLDELEDIAGIRIICQMVEDIDKVVKLIRNRNGKDLKIVEERDYINNIKESGYRSYHIIIKYWVHTAFGEKEIFAEIQIRTLAMNFWATIEHSLNYKFDKNIPDDIKKRLKNAAEAAFILDKEMSKIRDEIVDAQELFIIKSSLIAKILKKVQLLYFSGNFDNIDEIQKEFQTIREKGSVEELRNMNRKLEQLMQKYYLEE